MYKNIAVSLYTETTTLQSNILTSAFSTFFFGTFQAHRTKLPQVKSSKLKKLPSLDLLDINQKKSAERFLYTANSENVTYTCRKYSRCKLVNIHL